MGGRVDLNCDVGESFGAWPMGADADVIPSVTSVNIACGYHAGDPGVMRRTVRFAQAAAASIGAHPGLPDLAGFGRREMAVSARELEDMILYQIGALAAIARAEGAVVAHVKAHGALYNMAARDRALAGAIAKAVASFDRALVFYALAGSPMLDVGREAGLTAAAEGFADRSYEADGSLTPRARPGAVITDPRSSWRAQSAWSATAPSSPRPGRRSPFRSIRSACTGIRRGPTRSRASCAGDCRRPALRCGPSGEARG